MSESALALIAVRKWLISPRRFCLATALATTLGRGNAQTYFCPTCGADSVYWIECSFSRARWWAKRRTACCYVDSGENYRGTAAVDEDGFNCTSWPNMTVENSAYAYMSSGLGDGAGNYCRNPDHDGDGPWCLTEASWGYCSQVACASPV